MIADAYEDSKHLFMVGYEDGFYATDAQAQDRQEIPGASIDSKHDGRLNDGRCDRQGRFICGGYNAKETDGTWNKYQTVW